MFDYFTRNWLGERSTRWGLAGIALSLAGLVASFAVDQARWGDVAATVREVAGAVLAAGIIAVLYRERPKC